MKHTRNIITENIEKIESEYVLTAQCLGRIAAVDLLAKEDSPRHDESLRDGYVIGPLSEAVGQIILPIESDIPAGIQKIASLENNAACRIYTGGLIPDGADRVVPFEVCREINGQLHFTTEGLAGDRRYIKKRGSDVLAGEILAGQGTRLTPEHLWLLSAAGVTEVEVARTPVVGCFCTGSELVQSGGEVIKGQKISINSLLLQKQLPLYGAVIKKNEIIPDDARLLLDVFNCIKTSNFDLVVTTGGMGPGKYDLVEEAFREAGGDVLLGTLPMQPGKSILIGKLDNCIVVSLPGPPHAVSTLVDEMVGPVLLHMQGVHSCWPQTIQAELQHDHYSRKDDITQVKSGVLSIIDGKCYVRLAKRLEAASSYVVLPSGRNSFFSGEMVDVHLPALISQNLVGHF